MKNTNPAFQTDQHIINNIVPSPYTPPCINHHPTPRTTNKQIPNATEIGTSVGQS